MNITDVLDGIFDYDVGWRPVSGSIKPVHVANGLFRSLLRVRYSIKGAVIFLRPTGDEERTYEFLAQKSNDPRFLAFADNSQKARFEQLREYAKGLLAADGAVFPSAENSSLTLTCREMISADRNDRNVGAFAATLVRGRNGAGPLSGLVAKWLSEDESIPSDPLTALASPLLSHEPERLADDKSTALIQNPTASEIITRLEGAATRLAEHDTTNKNRLGSLERTVRFAILGLLSHAQALSAGGDVDKRRPLLLTARAEKGSALSGASEKSLNLFFEAFEEFLIDRLRHRLKRNMPIKYGSKRSDDIRLSVPPQTQTRVAKFFKKIQGYRNACVTSALLEDRLNRWSRARHVRAAREAALVMADALVNSYLEENRGGNPRAFLQTVGCRAGLIYPHFEGRSSEKRIRPSAEILEVLVKACTPANEVVPDRKFLDELWRTFGYITGGRPDDALLLEEAGIEIGFEELVGNWEQLLSRLTNIGLARRYPDNISYIGRLNA
jgi:hypothetical protein